MGLGRLFVPGVLNALEGLFVSALEKKSFPAQNQAIALCGSFFNRIAFAQIPQAAGRMPKRRVFASQRRLALQMFGDPVALLKDKRFHPLYRVVPRGRNPQGPVALDTQIEIFLTAPWNLSVPDDQTVTQVDGTRPNTRQRLLTSHFVLLTLRPNVWLPRSTSPAFRGSARALRDFGLRSV